MFWVRLFMIPWALTVVVEEAGALIWGYRKPRDLWTVFWINTLTNPAVTALRYLCNQSPALFEQRTYVLVILELAVLFGEWALYRHFLSKGKYFFLLSLTLNAASFGAGLLLPVVLSVLSRH